MFKKDKVQQNTNNNVQLNQNDKPVGIEEQQKKAAESEQIGGTIEERKSIDEQLKKIHDRSGILIYESARKKLDISDDGRIYRQKLYNYLPIISLITVIAYVNFVFGKTKCLKDDDFRLFKRANFWCNIVYFVIMPIAAIGLWTFGTWLMFDIIPDQIGNYTGIWDNYFDSIRNADTIALSISNAIGGLFTIAIAPLVGTANFFGQVSDAMAPVSVQIRDFSIPLNYVFIALFVLFTIVNPLNVIFTFIMNARILRFITVYETSSVYRYRN